MTLAGVTSPALWGSQAWLEESFGAGAHSIQVKERRFTFRYRSADHFVEVFRTWYGPVHKAFAALPEDKAKALEGDMTGLLNGLNRAGPGSLVVPSEYVEVVITRR